MKKDKLPKPISIMILTLLTATVWISLSVYRAITTGPAPVVPENVTSALTPTLNKDSINKIESSIYLNDSEIPQNITQASTTPVPTQAPLPTNAPIASPSATPLS
jgi:hypothetical protein